MFENHWVRISVDLRACWELLTWSGGLRCTSLRVFEGTPEVARAVGAGGLEVEWEAGLGTSRRWLEWQKKWSSSDACLFVVEWISTYRVADVYTAKMIISSLKMYELSYISLWQADLLCSSSCLSEMQVEIMHDFSAHFLRRADNDDSGQVWEEAVSQGGRWLGGLCLAKVKTVDKPWDSLWAFQLFPFIIIAFLKD